jgi:hypothetical protein
LNLCYAKDGLWRLPFSAQGCQTGHGAIALLVLHRNSLTLQGVFVRAFIFIADTAGLTLVAIALCLERPSHLTEECSVIVMEFIIIHIMILVL